MPSVPFLDLRAAEEELAPELEAAALRVMRSGRYILGAELEAFEAEFAAYCGAAHCIGVGNGLDAIALLLRAYGVGEGAEVVVPAHTFIASWLGVTLAGAVPVPAPVRSGTANLDPERIASAITPRTRAIMAVHLYGQPAEMGALRAVSDEHGLLLLEDAAQAQGAAWQGRRAGSLADGAAFSFYPGKNLGALGDAGAITCDDAQIAARCRTLRNYGSPTKYVHDELGVNSRLDELQAALLRVKLDRLDEWNERRRRVAERYLTALEGVVELPRVAPGAEPVWHLFVIRHPDRDALARRLADAGVATLIHYPTAPHATGAYENLGLSGEAVDEAAGLSRLVLSLPMGPHLTGNQVEHVIAGVGPAVAAG